MDVLMAASYEEMNKATKEGAEAIRDKAQDLLSETAHERGTKTPSAPGSPPA